MKVTALEGKPIKWSKGKGDVPEGIPPLETAGKLTGFLWTDILNEQAKKECPASTAKGA